MAYRLYGKWDNNGTDLIVAEKGEESCLLHQKQRKK